MTKTILLPTIWIPLFFLLSIASALTVGHVFADSADMRLLGLGRCDDRPCVGGMVPGETSWHTAQRVDPDAVTEERTIYISYGSVAVIEYYRSVDEISIGRTYVNINPAHTLAAGWIITHFGDPCGVTYYDRARILTLRYPNMLANIRVTERGRYMHMPVTQLQFGDPAFVSELQPNWCVDNITGSGAVNLKWESFNLPR